MLGKRHGSPSRPLRYRRSLCRHRGGYERLEIRAMLNVDTGDDGPLHDESLAQHWVDGRSYDFYSDPLPPPDLETDESSSVVSRALHPLSSLPQLNSNLDAPVTFYLDFNGHNQGTWVNYNNVSTPVFDIDGNPTTYSDQELERITRIWQRVSEDYSPFNVNVSTVEPLSFDDRVALRVPIGGSWRDWYGTSAGGVAYVNSFTDPTLPNVVYVFNTSEVAAAEAISHEIGHSLGLYHVSLYDEFGNFVREYHPGGNGWAPIMGESYYQAVTTWHNGRISNRTASGEIQFDLQVIGSANNGFGVKPDDHGTGTASATPITQNGNQISGSGIIERFLDRDEFSIVTPGGSLNVTVDPAPFGANIDVILTLLDANGDILTRVNPSGLSASISTNLSAGTYYLRVESDSTYGYLGQYTIRGTVAASSNGQLHGTLWNDLNADGQRGADEPALRNWQVFLDTDGDRQLDFGERIANTDANGNYSFTGLTPGTYNVVEALQHGWKQTSPVGPDAFESNESFGSAKQLASGSQWYALSSHASDDKDYYRWTAPSSGTVMIESFFEHAKGDMDLYIYDAGTNFIDGSIGSGNQESVTINVAAGQTILIESYAFVWHEAQEYTLRITHNGQVPPAPPLADKALGAHVVFVTSGQTVSNLNFGNILAYPGNLSGQVWNDINGDGLQNESEQPLVGWGVYLDENRNGQLDQTNIQRTNSSGADITEVFTLFSTVNVTGATLPIVDVNVTLNFTHPSVDDLDVFLISPFGTRVELFTDVGGDSADIVNVTLSDEAIQSIAAASAPLANSSYRPEGSLAVYEGHFANGNWTLDVRDDSSGDLGRLESWTLTLTFGEQHTATDSAGNYQFNVEPGQYSVQPLVPIGWDATWPNTYDGGYEISVEAGQSEADLDFGNRLPPIPINANDDHVFVNEDSGIQALAVLENDQGRDLTIINFSQPASGIVTNQGSHFEYSPTANFFGTDTFTYSIRDNLLETSQATVTVHVVPVNDAPQANADAFAAGAEVTTVLPVLANDSSAPDVGENLTIIDVSSGSEGGNLVNFGGQLQYTSAPGFIGTETFTYTISDGMPNSTDTATVTVNVQPDPAPVVSAGAHVGRPSETVTVPVSLNNAAGVSSIVIQVSYDTTHLDVAAGDIRRGTLTGSFSMGIEVNDATGTFTVTLTSGQPLPAGPGSLFEIDFHVSASAVVGNVITLDINSATLNGGTLPASNFDGSLEIIAPLFEVTHMETDLSAVHWTLNRALDVTELNLYEGYLSDDQSDVLAMQLGVGPVPGSLVWDDATQRLSFIKSGGPFEPGTYEITLHGRADGPSGAGIVDLGGEPLDGDLDRTPGGVYARSFTVTASSSRTLSLLDYARGPGQAVELPGTVNSAGIPLSINDAGGITQLSIALSFDPALLEITNIVLDPQLPVGWQVDSFDASQPGLVHINLSGSTLPSGSREFGKLLANVPANAPWGAAHLLQFQSVQLNGGSIPAAGDSALGVTAFVGDATGDGTYSGTDAAYVSRVLQQLDSGFDAYQNIDPFVIASVTGGSTLGVTDAAWIARKSVGLQQDEIPDLPPAQGAPVAPRDVAFSIPDLVGVAGELLVAAIHVNGASGILAIDLTLQFDTSVLDVRQVLPGSLTMDFNLVSRLDETTGTVHAALYRANPLVGGAGSAFAVEFDIPENTHATTELDLLVTANEGGLASVTLSGMVSVGLWQNPNSAFDVDNDADVDVVDALIVINELLSGGARSLPLTLSPTPPPPFVDIDGDGDLDVTDALLVINYLLSKPTASVSVASTSEAEPKQPAESEIEQADTIFSEIGDVEISVRAVSPPSADVQQVDYAELSWAIWTDSYAKKDDPRHAKSRPS